MNFIKSDLHLHSKFSDGEDTPESIVIAAKNRGIKLIAICDHDTVGGVKPAMDEGVRQGVEVFSGIELSCFSFCEVHILGYNFNIYDSFFLEGLERLKKMRLERMDETLLRLKAIGKEIDESYLDKGDGQGIYGRVHIAKAMVKSGYAESVTQAFDKWIGYGKAAYVPSHRISPSDGVKFIKKAGGKAVLAHPSIIKTSQQNLFSMIKGLKDEGLDGIEVDYSAHTTAETKYYKQIATQLDLISTCGSDYHGKDRDSDITAFSLSKGDYQRLKA